MEVQQHTLYKILKNPKMNKAKKEKACSSPANPEVDTAQTTNQEAMKDPVLILGSLISMTY